MVENFNLFCLAKKHTTFKLKDDISMFSVLPGIAEALELGEIEN